MRRSDGSADHYEWIEDKDRHHKIANPISPILADYLRVKRRGKKTVAIVGSAWTSGPWAPFGETEVWCSNEIHGLPWCQVDKATRWFQLHPKVSFTRKHKYDHWEWLRKEHPFPIYMQQVYDDVPSSVKYPLREIQENLNNIIKGEEVIRKPFSSTMCYQIAMALHEGYKRIEIFGVELLLDGEWAYQREAMAYWAGKADGMGVEVWIPRVCALLAQPLYAYEEVRHGYGGEVIWSGGKYTGTDITEAAITEAAIPRLDLDPAAMRSRLSVDGDAWERWGDRHKNETAIIIGNGSSLSSVPMELLNKHTSFGANLIHYHSLQPTYFSCIGRRYLMEFPGEMYDTAAHANIAFLGMPTINENIPDLQKLYALDNAEIVHRDYVTFPGEYQAYGGTVTYANLKIAYFMGFDTVLLVGCDHEREYKHFYGNHINVAPEDWKWHDMTYHYFVASEVYKEAGKRIVNLSNPSRLDEFFEHGEIGDWL